jgi:hypothetical protein
VRIGPGLRIDELEGGGVRLTAADWPYAAWIAAPCSLMGAPLLVWSALHGKAIEAGGALVFCAFAAVAAWLGRAKRRALVLRAAQGGARVEGREGAWPFARPVAVDVAGPIAWEVVAFPVPPGAPQIPDRGGDLVLRGGAQGVHLARAVGPRWEERLHAARQRLAARVAPGGG